ncbi:hypothetical protein IC216_06240 [Clostridioides sp. ES-S-0145-01]|uniref:hypothetical protein n=1 Tax=Clostridioides sp. ES-S-0145-01 TaxID=2770784 RepID=UPI001D10F4B4|nr:hypothetical protein [Clostridioides sp. ES-S-0145-01]
MKCLNDILEEAKLTGNGLALRYKEKPSFRLSEDYKCPYCKNKKNKSHSDWYETDEDIKIMIENTGYSWTEDRKCDCCGKVFSMRNGC